MISNLGSGVYVTEENMNDLKWRPAAQIVAIFDCILNVVGLLVIILVGVLATLGSFHFHEGEEYTISFIGAATGRTHDDAASYLSLYDLSYPLMFVKNASDKGSAEKNANIYILAILVTVAIFKVIYFWGIIKLIKATNKQTNSDEALKMAGTWTKFNLVYIVILMFLPSLISFGLYLALPCIILRGIALFIVSRLMMEMRIRSEKTLAALQMSGVIFDPILEPFPMAYLYM